MHLVELADQLHHLAAEAALEQVQAPQRIALLDAGLMGFADELNADLAG